MNKRIKSARTALSKGFLRWAGWMEKQGFYVMVGLCLAVIVGSALWTRQPVPDPPPESVAVGEAGEFQQRLTDVMKTAEPEPTPAPTATPPPRWVKPLSGEVTRGFSPNELIYQSTIDGWAAHPAADVGGASGEPALAPADGKVYAVETDARYGLTVTIRLEDGSLLSLMGLKSASASMGDNIAAGQSVGTAGGLIAAEALDPAHIHVYWEKNGKALDPSLMWD
ncbi:MAG: M23 family metallopeptidase [Oscillospiraceae bacterium]|jgi:murein DD-endopeptidase MepM/ murein hydrolase activator NlpD|nr:M23 family metallopeptidase [Oscillospiraceae bacterium]